jgi:hypothetical protein
MQQPAQLFFHCQVDAALQDLMMAVQDLCAFHRPGESGRATPPVFLFGVSQEDFHQAEDQYLKELTEYTKKQFFKVCAISDHFGKGSSHLETTFGLQIRVT